jgi:YD repeat-containing protein
MSKWYYVFHHTSNPLIGCSNPQWVRTIALSYNGLAITTTDTAGGITHTYTRRYDGLGRGNGHLVEVDDAGGTAIYRYGAGGHLMRASDPLGNAILAGYDGFGDKLTLTDPDKGNWSYGYDGYGEQRTQTNARGQVITTAYDALGRVLSVSDPADHRLTHTTYDTAPDGVGRAAVETVSENGSVSYTRRIGYDTAGRASVSEITTGGHTYLQGTHYDGLGRPDQQAYPALNGGSNQAPTVSASESPGGPVLPQTLIQLNASASDPNGTWQLSYHWVQMRGPAVTLTAADSAQATVTLPAVGSYHFTVTASDGLSTASASVTIAAEMPPPAARGTDAEPQTERQRQLQRRLGSGERGHPLPAAGSGQWKQQLEPGAEHECPQLVHQWAGQRQL